MFSIIMALLTEPLCFCQLVTFSILITALHSLTETPVINPPQKLKMNSQNFRHNLSWEAGSNTPVPTYYRVKYIDLSKPPWKIAKECSNITHLFCDLTEEYKDYGDTYIAIVQSFTEHGVFNSSTLDFCAYRSTYLGPPTVSLTDCPDCIYVNVKLPDIYLKGRSLLDVYERINYVITVESFETKEKIPWQIKGETSEESFNYVVSSLLSSTNYCVSVAVSASLNGNSIASAWNCIITRSTTQSGYVLSPVLGGGFFSLVIGFLLIGLYKSGCIFLKTKPWPKVLEAPNKSHCSVHRLDPEEVCSVQVIAKEIKRKEWKYSYDDDDDDSESDSENSGKYTRNDILKSVLRSHAKSDTFMQQSIDCTSAESHNQPSELLDSDVENSEENQCVIGENHLSEVSSSSTSGLSNNVCLNINLNTVILRDPDKTWDDSSALISLQEDSVDLQDSSASDALESKSFTNTVDVRKPDCDNLSHEREKPSVSDESDISDSEYIRR